MKKLILPTILSILLLFSGWMNWRNAMKDLEYATSDAEREAVMYKYGYNGVGKEPNILVKTKALFTQVNL